MQERAEVRVEADIILDEKNAVIFYPLCDIGQGTAQDPNSGLSELIATVARIGPRYRVVWLIFEEYSWHRASDTRPRQFAMENSFGPIPVQSQHQGSFATGAGARSSLAAAAISTTHAANVASSQHRVSTLRLDPYPGPVMGQLNKFMAWRLTSGDQRAWLSNLSHGTPSSNEQPKDPFTFVLGRVSELKFETRVLFASDERCAAWMTHAIGEAIVARIDSDVQAKVRRDEDGWQSREEWTWRDWLNEQDSTVK